MQKYTLTFLLLIFTILSCKKEEELPNPQLDFRITTTGNVEVMHQKETIIASFEEEKDIKAVFFTVDGKKIAEDREAPFEVEWNTLEESDGAHTLIVTAINAAGTPFESSLDVRVSNIFVTVEAMSGYLTSRTSDIWCYISDSEGNIIGEPAELKDGQVLKTLRPEGFTGDKYNFNLLEMLEYPTGVRECYVETYAGLTPGKYFGYGYTPQDEAPIDEFQVTINRNTTDPEHVFLLPNLGTRPGHFNETLPSSLIQHQVFDKDESDRYFITYQSGTGFDYAFYKKFAHSPDTEEYHFDAGDFTPMDKKTLPLNVTATFKYSKILGIDGTDTYYLYEAMSDEISKAIPFYTIDAEFEEYIYDFIYSTENGTWEVWGKGNPADAEFMENAGVESSISDNVLTVESIEGVDYLYASKQRSQADFIFAHAYMGANDGSPVIFPEVPELLKEKYPEIPAIREEEKEIYIRLTDYNKINSYDNWLNMQFSKEQADFWDYSGGYTSVSKTVGTTTTSGRWKTNPFLKPHRERAALRNIR